MFKKFVFGIEFIYKIYIDDKIAGYNSSKNHLNKTASLYSGVSSSIDSYTKDIPGHAKDSPKRFGRTIKNMFVNAIDNTFGYFASSWQNYKTKQALKKGDDKPIVYTIHGRVQNIGSHWRMGKELKKQGFHVYHLKGNHGIKDIDERKNKAYDQLDQLHKYSIPSKSTGYISGHSSGADLGIAMASDDRINDYGIKAVQARAPVPYGMKKSNLYATAVGSLVDIKSESRKTPEGQQRMFNNYITTPKVPVYVTAGKNDRLVSPKDAFYKDATSFKILNHKDSGHFGTSGQNKEINKYFVNEIKNIHGNYDSNYDNYKNTA